MSFSCGLDAHFFASRSPCFSSVLCNWHGVSGTSVTCPKHLSHLFIVENAMDSGRTRLVIEENVRGGGSRL